MHFSLFEVEFCIIASVCGYFQQHLRVKKDRGDGVNVTKGGFRRRDKKKHKLLPNSFSLSDT